MSTLPRRALALLLLASACNVEAPPPTPADEAGEEPAAMPQPPPYGPFFIAPNIDDDDGDGEIDFYQPTPPAGDDEVYVLTVPAGLFAAAGSSIGLAASGDVANLNLRYKGKDILGPAASEPCPEIPIGGADLEIQMSKPARFVTLTFHLLDDNSASLASQSIRIASSPILLNHHLQQTERVWVMKASWEWPSNNPPPANNVVDNTQMVDRLSALLGAKLTTLDGGQLGQDIWVQDELETATATASFANQRLDTMLNSPRDRDLDKFVTKLAAPDTAVVKMPGSGSTYDSFGNLETSPPVTVGGVSYPFGRIYYGSAMDAALKQYFKGQYIPSPVGFEVQKPFELDTGWLDVGHVDEVVTMLPDPSASQGFRVLIASPNRAIEIMKNLDPASKLPLYGTAYKHATVGEFLADANLMTFNQNLETLKIGPIHDTLKAELGLAESDFYPVPILFKTSSKTKALTVGMVNLLLVNLPGQSPLAVIPDPFFREDVGDRFDPYNGSEPATYDPAKIGDQSKDPFIAAMKAVLPAGTQAEFVDDWMYHRRDGEVHCGTNSQRAPSKPGGKPWWQALPLPPLVDAPWTCGCKPKVYSATPAFVGTPTPTSGGAIDWSALDQELVTYRDAQNLAFTVKVPYDPGNGCGSIPFELPVPCGAASYTDYTLWRMGGAAGVILVPPQLPQIFNDWVYNPGYFAEGMMDPFYDHPAKSFIVECQGLGVGFCSIGTYGPGTSDTALIPSDLARTDTAPAPLQPGSGAYDGHIRAFPVHQRAQPDPTLPVGYDLCYDNVDLHAQGGGIQGTCQNDGQNHGSIYLLFQATEKVCAAP